MLGLAVRLASKLPFEELGMSSEQAKQLIQEKRNPFSKYLPYLAYDPEKKLYINKDNTVGFLFIAKPLWNEIATARQNLAALIQELPDNATLSIHLISSSRIEPILQEFIRIRSMRNDPLIRKAAEQYAEFLRKAAKHGLPHALGTPVRDLYVIISLKFPKGTIADELLPEYRTSIHESLKRVTINCIDLEPDILIRILFDLFNGRWFDIEWNEHKPISSQIILADTPVEFNWNYLKLGSGYWAFVTPKTLPREFYPAIIGELTGPTDGPQSDSRQLPGHFIATLVVVKNEKLSRDLQKKATLFQRQVSNEGQKSLLARLLGEYYEEHTQALMELEEGKRFFYSFMVFMVQGEDEVRCKKASQRTKILLEEYGFPAQEERGILPILFLMSLPFGCCLRGSDIDVLDRHFVTGPEQAAALAPIVGEISGFGEPAMLFVGRKGQLVTFNPFTHAAPNKNCIIFGESGRGKSVNMNLMVYALYASGAAVYIVDLGYSYLKQCKIHKGQYIDFSFEKPVCLNPFAFVNENDPEDVQDTLNAVSDMVLAMAFAGKPEGATKEHKALVRYAVQYAWREFGKEACIDHIHEYLAKFPYRCGEEIDDICLEDGNIQSIVSGSGNVTSSCVPNLREEAQKLGFSLFEWTSKGTYGPWFNGKPNIDLTGTDFLVLEMEKLKRDKLLMALVTHAVLNVVTALLYLTDRSKKKFILVEECGQLLSEASNLAAMVTEAYRRVRKYGGAIATVFQSPYDLDGLGVAGKVVTGNTAFWFFAPSSQYAAIKEDAKHFGLDDFIVERLKTIELVKPRYGEIGLKTPWGFGVVRTVMDGFTYYLVTTDPDDWAKVENLQKELIIKMREKYPELSEEEIERQALAEALSILGKERDEQFRKRFIG